MTLAAIVLAAGASRRMGRPKPLLPWRNSTLLEHELAVLAEAGIDRVAVVLGARADLVRRALGADRPFVFNARWGAGRSTSLARGAWALRPAEGDETPEAVLVQNVDQPTTAATPHQLGRCGSQLRQLNGGKFAHRAVEDQPAEDFVLRQGRVGAEADIGRRGAAAEGHEHGNAVALGARDAGREAIILERLFQGADHPVPAAFPEGLYLSSIIAMVHDD